MLFLSGASALLFQTLWLRLSGLTFGNSAWSAALILSSFMAGLALGGAIAATTRIRRARPLRIYPLLEVAIAIFGCAIVFVLPSSGSWLHPLFQSLAAHQTTLNVLRFGLSFLILLVPTTAMGLSLPVLIEDPLFKKADFGRSIGLLYGANTLGAVAGAIAGEAWLVAAFGILGTSVIAGALNCAAAAIALLLSRVSGGAPATTTGTPEIERARIRIPIKLSVVSFGCGAALLTLEVVWLRFLRLYVASSAIAFAVMLAVVLAGIGLGSLAAALLSARNRLSGRWLTHLLLLTGLASLLCYVLFPVPSLQAGQESYYFESWPAIVRLSLALMFPVAFLSGALFPLVAASVHEQLGSRMNSTGVVTLFNTIGATVGPLAASFVCLPYLGFQTTLLISAALYAALALLTLPRDITRLRKPSNIALLALALALVLSFVLFPYKRAATHLANARHSYEVGGLELVKVVEGTSDTYQLLRRQLLGETYYYRLLTNAYSMSATNPLNQRYMRLSAYLPRILRPEAKNGLLICYGLGATADALLRGDQLQHVDIVDISREVFALSPLHSDARNPDPLLNPKATALVQDGRFYLQSTRARYDVITGEPPPPKVAGSVNLYTQEFFTLLAGALTDDGVATFWLPIYQLQVHETKAILRAFRNAFPSASVWASSDYEWIMMGSKSAGRPITEAQFGALWSDAATGPDLRRIGLETPAQTAALFIMDGDEIDRITRDVPPLTDLYPKRLSDASPDPAATHEFAWPYIEASEALKQFRASSFVRHFWPPSITESLEPYFIARETRYLSNVAVGDRFAELDLYLRRSKLRGPVLDILGSDFYRLEIARHYAEAHPDARNEATPDLVAGALGDRDIPRAIAMLEETAGRITPTADDVMLLTYLYCVNGDPQKAEVFAAAHTREIAPEADQAAALWRMLQALFGFRPPAA